MEFQPDQLEALRSVLDKNAMIASALGDDYARIRKLLRMLEKFANDNVDSLKSLRFTFQLEPTTGSGGVVSVDNVIQAVKRATPCIHIDSEFRIISTTAEESSISASLARTSTKKSLEIVFYPSTLHYVACGQHIHDTSIEPASTPMSQQWYRPFADFDKILDDHMNGAVQFERDLRYWKDRKKRVLLATPDGTEKIFHGKLRWWLDTFLMDKLKVFAQPTGFGQDAIDIVVITTSRVMYLIEVKWLGKNENGTHYDHTQINKGLVQVKAYLDKNDDVLAGYLVIYDGRAKLDHVNKSTHDTKHLHSRCSHPRILFLESETPSEIGAKLTQ